MKYDKGKEYDSEFVSKWVCFIRNRITELRMRSNQSEYELSRRLDKANSYIHSIVSGKTMPSIEALFTICEEFDIDPVTFFGTEHRSDAACRISQICEELEEKDLELLLLFAERLRSK